MIGVIYIAVIEGLLGNLPFGIRLITVIYYALVIASRALSYAFAPPYSQEDPVAEIWQLNLGQDPQLMSPPSTATCLAVLLVGSAVCALLAAWICSRREFHVKTPEKA